MANEVRFAPVNGRRQRDSSLLKSAASGRTYLSSETFSSQL
jgi:hypothetical protein